MNCSVIDEIFYDALSLLKEMISTPSHSREEKDVADVVFKFIEEKIIEIKLKFYKII